MHKAEEHLHVKLDEREQTFSWSLIDLTNLQTVKITLYTLIKGPSTINFRIF